MEKNVTCKTTQSKKSLEVEKICNSFFSEGDKGNTTFITEKLFDKSKYIGKTERDRKESKALLACIKIFDKKYEGTHFEHKVHVNSIREFIKIYKTEDRLMLFTLGYCYQNGKGADKNFEEALKQYRIATQSGFQLPQVAVNFVKSQVQSIHKSLVLSCINDMGHISSEKREMSIAIEYFLFPSANGSSAATYNLGYCYEYNKGVEKNVEQAKRYYQQASDKGFKKATDAFKRLSEQN